MKFKQSVCLVLFIISLQGFIATSGNVILGALFVIFASGSIIFHDAKI